MSDDAAPDFDDLAEKLFPDPSQGPPDVMVLTGWIGHASSADHIRLYLLADLSEFVEFHVEDIVHHEKIPAAQPSMATTLVWLKRSAEMHYTRRIFQSKQTDFLGGSVAASFLSRFGRVGGWGGGGFGGGGGQQLISVPPNVSVCSTCPTNDGSHTCVPAVCTLATNCGA